MKSYSVCSGPMSKEIETGKRVVFHLQGYGALSCDITEIRPGLIKGTDPSTGRVVEVWSYNPDTQTGEAIIY